MNNDFIKIYFIKANPQIKYIFSYENKNIIFYTLDNKTIESEVKTFSMYLFNNKEVNNDIYESKIFSFIWSIHRVYKNFLIFFLLKKINIFSYSFKNLGDEIRAVFNNRNIITSNINNIFFYQEIDKILSKKEIKENIKSYIFFNK